MRKRAKTDSAKLIRKCDVLWSKLVRKRADFKCEWCGAPARDAHHMVARRRSAYLRHRIENGVALCASCHFNFHNKESYTGWFKFERDRYDDFFFVRANMYEIWKCNTAHYKEVLNELMEDLNEDC